MLITQAELAVVLASRLQVSVTVTVSILAGVIAGGTAIWSLRAVAAGDNRLQSDLLRPYAAVAAIFALGALAVPFAARQLRAGVLSVLPLVTFLLVFIPWNVFAFRYAGRGRLVTRQRLLAVGSLVTMLLVLYVSVAAGVVQPSQESYSSVLLGASTLLLGLVALTFVSSGLVLTEAYRHDSIPLASGIVVVFPIAVLVVGIQVVSLSNVLTRELLAGIHLFVSAAVLPVAIARYDVVAMRPGTTTLGERTVVQDLNEPVLVSDWDGQIILSNQRAEHLFGADLDGRTVKDVVGSNIATLRESPTLECWTDSGYKIFDPRVSSVTGSQSRQVGQTVTLIDVTDQAMLRQRVQVLNRIFRHNIRNDLDVIRSHAESAVEGGSRSRIDDSADEILRVTDDILQLSADARKIEQLTRDSSSTQSVVNLPKLVDTVIETIIDDQSDVSVTVDIPVVELSVSREHLRFALQNLVDNAIEHNDNMSPHLEVKAIEQSSGIRLVVTDNGPGIPDTEWEVIETGEEEVHKHLTSLGLWGTKWAVQQMDGELSRRNRESGTAVIITLPRE